MKYVHTRCRRPGINICDAVSVYVCTIVHVVSHQLKMEQLWHVLSAQALVYRGSGSHFISVDVKSTLADVLYCLVDITVSQNWPFFTSRETGKYLFIFRDLSIVQFWE